MAPLGALSLLLLISAVVDGQKNTEQADRSTPIQVLDNTVDGYPPVAGTAARRGYLPLPAAGGAAASSSLENKDAAAANHLSEEPEEPAVVAIPSAVRVPIRRMIVKVRPRGDRRRTTTPLTPSVQHVSSNTESGVTEQTTGAVATPATAPASIEPDTDVTASASAPPVSNEVATDAPAIRRKIMKKRIRVVSHKSDVDTSDLVPVSTTTENVAVVTTEYQPETTSEGATETTSAASTIAPTIVQYPIRRQVKKRNKNLSSSSTPSSENRPSASSGIRRVIRRQGRISGGDGTSSVPARSSGGSSTNSKNPIKRRRIIGRKNYSPAADVVNPTASSPTKKRRARQPLDSVSALDATSGGGLSVQPLLVRPRVARHDGASSSAPDSPVTRRVIRRRGRVLDTTGSSSSSSASSQESSKIIRRRGRAKNLDVSLRSAPAKKRRARQPLDKVSALDATSGGGPSVQPLLVRPRVARQDGASFPTKDGAGKRRVIRRRGRVLDTTGSSLPSSTDSQEDSISDTSAVTRKIIGKRGRARNLDVLSSSAPAVQDASVSASSSVSPDPIKRRGRARSKARRPSAEEAATLANFTGGGSGGVSLVRPLVFRPRIARARSAVSAPDGIDEDSTSSRPAPQQLTRRRVIKLRRGQQAVTATTATVGQPVVIQGDQNEAEPDTQSETGPITRKVIRRRRPSARSNSVATPSATAPTITAITAASAEEPRVAVTTQQPTTTTEQPTSAEELSLPTELPSATTTSAAAVEASAVDLSGGLAGLSSVLTQGRRYQVLDRSLSSAATDTPTTTPDPVSRSRKLFRPKPALRGSFAKADRVQATSATQRALPPPQVSQPAPLLSSLPAVSSLKKHPEAAASINHIGELQSTLPAGGGTVVGDRPLSQFSCDARPYGYFADMETDCQVFHICTPVLQTNGVQQMLKHSFFCNNGTVFDQSTLSCRVTSAALPCARSGDFYASVDYGSSRYNYFDRLRQDQERRDEQTRQQQQQQQRLETLEDLERLEAQLS